MIHGKLQSEIFIWLTRMTFFSHRNFVLNARDVMPDLEKLFILEYEFLIFIFF